MSVNKVAVNGETIIDLTEDSVTPETLIKGMTAHNKAGEPITGSLEIDTREVWVCYPVPDLSQFSTAARVTTPSFTDGKTKTIYNGIATGTNGAIYYMVDSNLYSIYNRSIGWASPWVRVLTFDEPVDETSEAYAVLSKIATKTVFEALGSIQVSKSVSVTENGTVEIVPNSSYDTLLKATVEVNVDAPTPVLQEKTITPTTSEQIVTPDDGYDGLSSVTVEGINEAEQATPVITVSSTGLITAKSTQTAGYVSDGTKSATKQLTTQSAKTVTPSTSSQTAVSSGRYTTGNVTVAAVPTETRTVELSMASGNQTISRSTNKFMTSVVVKKPSTLIPENIKKDVVIGGVTGTYEGSGGGGSGSGSYNIDVTENSDSSQNLAITDAASKTSTVTIHGLSADLARVAYTDSTGVPMALQYSGDSRVIQVCKGSCLAIQYSQFEELMEVSVSGGFTLPMFNYVEGPMSILDDASHGSIDRDLYSVFTNNEVLILFYPTSDTASITFTF